ncbi:MAG TPA: iron-containing alcohol dehydrogenase [Terriglobia bacterium]|nr:iron-containing alcohol dehydrogenase [Terriglobia bacterium]
MLLDTSTIASTHHGTSNAVLLPPVMRFNATVVADRLKDLATAMSAEPPWTLRSSASWN